MSTRSTDLAAIERRLAKLEAVEEIRHLKLRYGQLCDAGYPVDPILEMFTADAVWDGGDTFGSFHGLDEIRTFFVGINEEVGFAVHYMIGDAVVVDDDVRTARATWHMFEAATMRVDAVPEAMWLAAVYEDEYRCEDGVWRFSSVKLNFRMQAMHREGWATRLLQL